MRADQNPRVAPRLGVSDRATRAAVRASPRERVYDPAFHLRQAPGDPGSGGSPMSAAAELLGNRSYIDVAVIGFRQWWLTTQAHPNDAVSLLDKQRRRDRALNAQWFAYQIFGLSGGRPDLR